MSAASLRTLRAAIANAKEDHAGEQHSDLRAALDAADSAAGKTMDGGSEPAPKTLKEASVKAREQFSSSHSSASSSSK